MSDSSVNYTFQNSTMVMVVVDVVSNAFSLFGIENF